MGYILKVEPTKSVDGLALGERDRDLAARTELAISWDQRECGRSRGGVGQKLGCDMLSLRQLLDILGEDVT